MRHLGIDPGTTIIGYGVIEEAAGSFRCLTYGVIRNPGSDQGADKQATLAALSDIIAQFKPDAAAVERLFFLNNKRSAMAVSEMRGVILLGLADHRLPVSEFTPLQVKQRICGHGGADKRQIQRMVRLLLKLRDPVEPDDAADALAIALCSAVTPRQY
jgi:crossover junction endodeoxyribonuclease RuvC